jgi:hypothetical protein
MITKPIKLKTTYKHNNAEAVQLFRDDFDTFDNTNPSMTRLLGTFIEKDGRTAHGNANKFIQELQPVKLYLGWDGKVYPQYRLVKIHIS